MSTLDIRVEPLEGVERGVVVNLDGALDQPTRDLYLSKFKALLAEGSVRCVLNMERVSYANSTAIGDLVNQFDLFREAGGDLVLLNPQQKVYMIIETVGLDNVLPIFKSLDDARAHLSATRGSATAAPAAPQAAPVAAPAVAPAAAGAPAAQAAPVAGAVPHVAFPLRAECSGCAVTLEFGQAGRFRCPRCGTLYGVDASGRATATRPRGPFPIEFAIPCESRALKAFAQFISSLPGWSGYTELERDRLEGAMAEVCDTILQRAYDGNKDTLFHAFAVCRDDELVVRIVDHGKPLSAAAFQGPAAHFSEFEYRPHPTRGNSLRIVKRAGK